MTFTTNEAPHMYFDVDDTLIKPIDRPVDLELRPFVKIDGQYFLINSRVIKDLRLCRARGHVCVVWSQGGSSWAHKVVKALGLNMWVDLAIAKPSWYVDDRASDDILDNSRWYDGSF